jgi:hypothetical protein
VQLWCGSEGLSRRLCAEFGLDPDAPGLATDGERVGNRQQGRRAAGAHLRRPRPPDAARCRRGWWSTSRTPRWACCGCPARRCASSPPAVPRGDRDHAPRARGSPVLGGSDAEIRAWLAEWASRPVPAGGRVTDEHGAGRPGRAGCRAGPVRPRRPPRFRGVSRRRRRGPRGGCCPGPAPRRRSRAPPAATRSAPGSGGRTARRGRRRRARAPRSGRGPSRHR